MPKFQEGNLITQDHSVRYFLELQSYKEKVSYYRHYNVFMSSIFFFFFFTVTELFLALWLANFYQ